MMHRIAAARAARADFELRPQRYACSRSGRARRRIVCPRIRFLRRGATPSSPSWSAMARGGVRLCVMIISRCGEERTGWCAHGAIEGRGVKDAGCEEAIEGALLDVLQLVNMGAVARTFWGEEGRVSEDEAEVACLSGAVVVRLHRVQGAGQAGGEVGGVRVLEQLVELPQLLVVDCKHLWVEGHGLPYRRGGRVREILLLGVGCGRCGHAGVRGHAHGGSACGCPVRRAARRRLAGRRGGRAESEAPRRRGEVMLQGLRSLVVRWPRA
mmetsp:Transcript_19630/g.52963  ORF Transcript_19630/g.52963 Transcript_19630/m.52963 type:complete len:269 (-) Transcript_19630:1727-2533(-)